MASRVRAAGTIPRLGDAMESLGRVVRAAADPPSTPLFDGMLTALSKDHPDEGRLDGLVRHSLLAMLEERATRQSTQAHMAR